jgi:hypothetical protein
VTALGRAGALAGRGLDRFFAPQPYAAMVVCRIGFGLLLFSIYLLELPDVPALFGPQGVAGAAMHARLPDPQAFRMLEVPAFDWLHRVESMELVWALYGLLLLSSLAFALGAWTRTAGVVALVLHLLFCNRNYYAEVDWATMFGAYLLYVVIAPSGRFLSVDAWRKGLPTPPAREWTGPGWPVRLLQMHLCTMYAVAGWGRLDQPGWLDGQMLFVALTDRWYGRIDVDWFALRPILEPLSYGAFLLEPIAPVALWLPRVRTLCVLALLAMHAMLGVLTMVSGWSPMMMIGLTVFVPPAWVAAPFDWLRARLRR